MLIVPEQDKLSRDRDYLQQFLVAFKQAAIAKDRPKILHLSLAIPPVDPLAVLAALSRPDWRHFYLEKASEKEAIAAFDCAAQFETSGKSRFWQAQTFIQSYLNRIISFNNPVPDLTNPRFFCSFTFYDSLLVTPAPFAPATVFLPRWQVVRQRERCFLVANIEIDWQTNMQAIAAELWQQRQNILRVSSQLLTNSIPRSAKSVDVRAKKSDEFKQTVAEALELIQSSYLSKIVLSRTLEVTASTPVQTFHALHRLRQAYPNCTTFSASNGRGQTFIGASPERLIGIRDRQLTTEALAGSAPRGPTVEADAELANCLLNNDKERREHALVIDFIAQQLTQLGLQPKISSIPQLRQLANIQHIWTPIRAKLPLGIHPLEIVAALHPTPAVAGLARDAACEYLRRYEQGDRWLYASPLGWIDSRSNCEFIVGIRSALIDSNSARLYAGAGIVAGSDPDKELAEIQLKFQAMLEALL